MNGSAYVEVKSTRSNGTCGGTSVVTHIPAYGYIIPTCHGQKGIVTMNCEDGRIIKVDWDASSCSSGKGIGKDQFGNSFIFEFGMSKLEADKMLVSIEAKQQAKPNIPKLKSVVMEQRESNGSLLNKSPN